MANMKQITWLDFETETIIKAQLSELQLGFCATCSEGDVSRESRIYQQDGRLENPAPRDLHLLCIACHAKM